MGTVSSGICLPSICCIFSSPQVSAKKNGDILLCLQQNLLWKVKLFFRCSGTGATQHDRKSSGCCRKGPCKSSPLGQCQRRQGNGSTRGKPCHSVGAIPTQQEVRIPPLLGLTSLSANILQAWLATRSSRLVHLKAALFLMLHSLNMLI